MGNGRLPRGLPWWGAAPVSSWRGVFVGEADPRGAQEGGVQQQVHGLSALGSAGNTHGLIGTPPAGLWAGLWQVGQAGVTSQTAVNFRL